MRTEFLITVSFFFDECSTAVQPAIPHQQFPIPLKTTLQDKLFDLDVGGPI